MNANILKMQIFPKIKYDPRGHSRSQIMTFLIKNSAFLLFMLLIDSKNKSRWTLWKNKVWLIQRRHLLCFDLNLHSYGQHFVLVFVYPEPLKLVLTWNQVFYYKITFWICWFLLWICKSCFVVKKEYEKPKAFWYTKNINIYYM